MRGVGGRGLQWKEGRYVTSRRGLWWKSGGKLRRSGGGDPSKSYTTVIVLGAGSAWRRLYRSLCEVIPLV